MIRSTVGAVRAALEWSRHAPRHAGEFRFGPETAEPLVFGVFGDSVGCGLGLPCVEQSFAGAVAARLGERYRVICRITAVSGARGRGLAIQKPRGDERFAAVSIGTNDIVHGEPLPLLERSLVSFLERLRRAQRVVVLGPGDLAAAMIVPPLLRPVVRRRVQSCEVVLKRAVARFSNACHIGPSDLKVPLDAWAFAEDGFHPNERSHAVIAQEVYKRLAS